MRYFRLLELLLGSLRSHSQQLGSSTVCLEGRRYIDKYETVTYKAYDLATSAQARMDHLCRLIIESTIIKLVLLLRALVVKAREILSRAALRIGSLRDSNRTATIQEAIG